jgi:hypothetical protein
MPAILEGRNAAHCQQIVLLMRLGLPLQWRTIHTWQHLDYRQNLDECCSMALAGTWLQYQFRLTPPGAIDENDPR